MGFILNYNYKLLNLNVYGTNCFDYPIAINVYLLTFSTIISAFDIISNGNSTLCFLTFKWLELIL